MTVGGIEAAHFLQSRSSPVSQRLSDYSVI